MKKVDMIVKAPHFFTMEGEGVGYVGDAVMLIDGGKILEILPAEKAVDYQAEEKIILEHHAIFPGFIDGHMHTPINVMRGLAQDTNYWMFYGLQPFANVVTQEEMDIGSRVGIMEAIKAGTTTLGDYDLYMDNVCAFIDKVGARGNIAQTIRGIVPKIYAPGELYEMDDMLAEEMIARNLSLYDKWNQQAEGRIRILFGPQGADFLSLDKLKKVQAIAKERKTKLHMHVQQGDRETFQITKRYGKRPVELLESLGYLDDSLISVHLTDCTEQEAAHVAKMGASMVVNPGSIGIIDGVVCPSVAFQTAGGSCGLGSDQAPGNNCHNIINEMKNVALFNKIKFQNPEIMPAWKALRMATIEGARAVGVDDIVGSLTPGKEADFIAVDLDMPSMLPVYTYPMRNIVPNLVYSARGHEICLSVVHGQVIMRDQKLTKIDEQELIEKIKECPAEIGARASEEFFRINGTNAKFMEEGKL